MEVTTLKPEPVETETGGYLVLVPELMPQPLWQRCAAKVLTSEAWDAVCRSTLARSRELCSICSSPGGLVCGECWRYDDERGLATLTGFRSLCRGCDDVVHMGRAVRQGLGEQALERLCIINRIDLYHAVALYGHAINLWRARSKRQWQIAVSSSLIRRYPDLLIMCADQYASRVDA